MEQGRRDEDSGDAEMPPEVPLDDDSENNANRGGIADEEMYDGPTSPAGEPRGEQEGDDDMSTRLLEIETPAEVAEAVRGRI